MLHHKTNIVISHPRSGINYLRYIIEYVTGDWTPGSFRVSGFRAAQPIFSRTHWPWAGKEAVSGHNVRPNFDREIISQNILYTKQQRPAWRKVIMLLRDYRDYSYYDDGRWIADTLYADVLNVFRDYPGDKRHFYYEDMIDDPQSYFQSIFDYLNLDYDFTGFDFEFHQKRSLLLRKDPRVSPTAPGTSRETMKEVEETLERIRKYGHSNPKVEEARAHPQARQLDKDYAYMCGREAYNKYLGRYKVIGA